MLRAIAALLAFQIAAFCWIGVAAGADDDCAPADNLTYVPGGGECFAIQTYLPATGAASQSANSATESGTTLVVVLHGDLSRGGPADYIFPVAEHAADHGAVGVAMMRPGYSGGGRTSTGTASRRERRPQIYTADEMDGIAAAVQALKLHHAAETVVMIGHSGGAVMAGVILGRHPGLVRRALLISCPCDIPTWRRMRNRNPLPNAENPIDYVEKIQAGTVIRLLTGTKDTNTRPTLAADYAAKAAATGLDAIAAEIPGAGHNIDANFIASGGFQETFRSIVSGQ